MCGTQYLQSGGSWATSAQVTRMTCCEQNDAYMLGGDKRYINENILGEVRTCQNLHFVKYVSLSGSKFTKVMLRFIHRQIE